MSRTPASSPLLNAHGISKVYATPRGTLPLFRDLDLEVYPGEMVAIIGASGTGKSSLLHLLAALDSPTTGEVVLAGKPVGQLRGAQAAEYRNREIGYVWQFHYLLPEFSAAENVAMPLLARGLDRKVALDRAHGWLERVGLAAREDHRPGELSGGEQQRVSLARALVTEPKLLLADEPTGDLDEQTAESVFELMRSLHETHGLTAIVVTHNLQFATRCDRLLRLRDGQLRQLDACELNRGTDGRRQS